jgi:2-haloacid dehalogenase
MMVTAHIWDIAGAANAGMKTAFLERDKQLFYPLAPQPDIVCHTIPELASLLEEETQGFPIL